MLMKELPKIAQSQPFAVDVEAGKNYYWCSCGLSSKQPFCDGAHKGHKDEQGQLLMKPLVYTADADKKVYFCGCKNSKNGATCDGTHSNL